MTARVISGTLLVVGFGLMWPIPIAGALLMTSGAIGLAVLLEDGLLADEQFPERRSDTTGAPAPGAAAHRAA
jgi:hypothetical protein